MKSVLALVLFLAALTGCGSMTFVRKVHGPEKGGVVAYSGYGQDDAYEAMRDYCGKRGYDILEEGEGYEATGAVASTNAFGMTTAHMVGHEETYVTFKCRD